MTAAGNTILIAGGGSGIGRSLPQVGQPSHHRQPPAMDQVTADNPGMRSAVVDIHSGC
jgi:short-subunit dehydrogenase involved in D-alanine esterification of teichoic acids